MTIPDPRTDCVSSLPACDEESIAFHEAGHAVALWKLGFYVASSTIRPQGAAFGRALCKSPSIAADHSRKWVERTAIGLHAGDAATRLLRGCANRTWSSVDHHAIHTALCVIESDEAVQITWCNHLWQRAYSLLAAPENWWLVTGLAAQLLQHRTLESGEVNRYLDQAVVALRQDARAPNAMQGDVRYVSSPWHRSWYEKSAGAPPQTNPAAVPSALEGISARADLRPVASLGKLSTRARHHLDKLDVRTVRDLEDWNEYSLACFHGGGRKTVEEIADLAARAGVRLAPDRRLPWQVNPSRWRR